MLKDILFWVNYLLVIIAIFMVLGSRKAPSSAIAWILALITIPGIGLIAYILFGRNWKKRKLVRMVPEEVFSDHLNAILNKQKSISDALPRMEKMASLRINRTIHLLAKTASAPVTTDNLIASFFNGHDLFSQLLKDLETAKTSIHMEYYIWRSDAVGQRILDTLTKKAKEGVQVRLIFDGWGSFRAISYSYRRKLRAAGIQYSFFLNPSNPFTRMKINYRNHRKIVVIDGITAYTGGMNIGDEYITGGKRFKSWRDTHLRIKGSAVSMLQAVFLIDWHNSGNDLLLEESHFPIKELAQAAHNIPLQIAFSGPDSQWKGIHLHYLELINGAREEILIQTPYFIPGESIEQAIIAAALRGAKVKLMTLGIPDKRIPFWASQTYFASLLESGVEIYLYQAGFLHSKVVIQDRLIASVGTCNMDTRSFDLAYEVNTVIYSPSQASLHAEVFDRDLENCRLLTLDDLNDRSFYSKVRDAAFRLLSPII